MKKRLRKVRVPARRFGAESYLRIVLLTFAASVIVTRLYLEITGFPQIGGGSFHIAHVLWGGILLFFASLIPLVFSNRWVYPVSAVLTGVGTGQFIDEVGKFITETNDYFYPPAMPIIYAVFLLLVIGYTRVKGVKTQDTKKELYRSLDAMEEVLEHDLDRREYKELKDTLTNIVHESKVESHKALAHSLLEYLKSSQIELNDLSPNWTKRLTVDYLKFEEKYVKRSVYRAFIIFVLSVTGTFAFLDLITAIRATISPSYLTQLTEDIFIYGELINTQEQVWFIIRLIFEGIYGIFLLWSVRLFILKKDRKAITSAYYGLLLSLTTLNLLVFYFDQTKAIFSTLFNYLLLVLLLRYKEIYLFRSYKRNKT